jgi:diguanylate cyclase (GGDEF)-like protein/PAS domain S-box-containing protein
VLGAVLVFRDVTEEYRRRQQLSDSEEKYRLLIENAVSGIAVHEIVLDEQGAPVDYIFLRANPAFEEHTGLPVADVIGRRVTDVLPGIEDTSLIETYGKVVLSGEPTTFEQYVPPLRRYYMISAYRVTDRQFATVFLDVTERRSAEEALATANEELERALVHSQELAVLAEMSKRQAEQRAADLDYSSTHDELTGLANRREFERLVGERADLASAAGRELFAVLFMDLDKFKLVNDALGHDIGDLLLRETAERLKSCMRAGDVTARMGGDEFTAIVGGPGLRASCEKVASRILDQLTRPFDIGGHRLVVGVSVGRAGYSTN